MQNELPADNVCQDLYPVAGVKLVSVTGKLNLVNNPENFYPSPSNSCPLSCYIYRTGMYKFMDLDSNNMLLFWVGLLFQTSQ